MAHWLLEYDLADDYLERRGPLRSEHLGLAVAAHERGELLVAGALQDPMDRALLVFRGDDGGAAGVIAVLCRPARAHAGLLDTERRVRRSGGAG